MKTKQSPADKELLRRIDEVLHYIWDPIGVSGVPMSRNEYDSYVLRVFSLIHKNSSSDAIAQYLHKTEIETMGVTGNLIHAKEVAEILLDWSETIAQKNT